MTNSKTVLVIDPARLFSKKTAITIKQWFKTPEGFSTGECPLSRPQLKTWFKNFRDETITALLAFAPSALEKVSIGLNQQTSYIKNGSEKAQAIKKAYSRHIYSLVSSVRRQSVIQWYHEQETTDHRVQILKCSFYPYPVDLFCKVEKQATHHAIQLFAEVGKEKIPLQNFTRIYFLLLQSDCYFQVTPKSYEALQWLSSEKISCEKIENAELLETLLKKLKQWDIRIERTADAEIVPLTPHPRTQVLLSEINNSFLKLEPQFDYEGIIIDGAFEPIYKTEIKGKTVHIKRDKERETEFVDFLRARHDRFSTQNNGFFYLSFAEAQRKNWFLKTYHLLLERDIDLKGIDLLRHFRYAPYKIETDISQQKSEGDYISMKISVRFGKEQVPLPTLQKALLSNQKAVMLKDGSLGVPGDAWMMQYGLMIKHGKISGNELSVARWMLLGDTASPALDHKVVKSGVRDSWFAKWKQWELQDKAIYELPRGLHVTALRPYQRSGYEWMRLLEEAGAGACLADDMGLGKTLQTICFLLYKIEMDPGGRHLVVAPASLLYNWQKELEKFAPQVNTLVWHGTNKDMDAIRNGHSQVSITSYGTMRQNIQLIQEVSWVTVVLDESHNIKNPQAQTTRAAWQLNGHTKIILSGTPIMNSTADLHSQLHFLMPGLLGTPEFFKREYTIPIEQESNEEKAAILHKLVRPFLLRRTKEQVAKDLPPRTESVLWCEMGRDQRMAYETIREKIRANIFTEIKVNGLNKGKLSVLAGLTKLRQLCNSAELVKDEDVYSNESVKTEILIEELKCIIPQHRALVFSQFTSMLDLLERDLQKAGILSLRLDGSTDIKKRQELVNEFQSEDSGASVFLLSLKAGNTGLTLTKADYVFLYDPWWNSSVESQAIDRTHRIGQQQQVFAYRMICRDSIEEKIIKLAEGKKKIAEELISVDESLVKGLTMEDLEYLLS